MKRFTFFTYITLGAALLGATPTMNPYAFRIANHTKEYVEVSIAFRSGGIAGSTLIAPAGSKRLESKQRPDLLEAHSKNCAASVAIPPSPSREYVAIVDITNGKCVIYI